MAIFNAFTDRVPVSLFVAKGDSAGARDPVASVREFIKWVGEAGSPQTFPAVAARACQAALTPPMGPGAAIILDPCIAESSLPPASLPRVAAVYPPRGDPGAVAEAAQLLASAERPLICAECAARTPEGPGSDCRTGRASGSTREKLGANDLRIGIPWPVRAGVAMNPMSCLPWTCGTWTLWRAGQADAKWSTLHRCCSKQTAIIRLMGPMRTGLQ